MRIIFPNQVEIFYDQPPFLPIFASNMKNIFIPIWSEDIFPLVKEWVSIKENVR